MVRSYVNAPNLSVRHVARSSHICRLWLLVLIRSLKMKQFWLKLMKKMSCCCSKIRTAQVFNSKILLFVWFDEENRNLPENERDNWNTKCCICCFEVLWWMVHEKYRNWIRFLTWKVKVTKRNTVFFLKFPVHAFKRRYYLMFYL